MGLAAEVVVVVVAAVVVVGVESSEGGGVEGSCMPIRRSWVSIQAVSSLRAACRPAISLPGSVDAGVLECRFEASSTRRFVARTAFFNRSTRASTSGFSLKAGCEAVGGGGRFPAFCLMRSSRSTVVASWAGAVIAEKARRMAWSLRCCSR